METPATPKRSDAWASSMMSFLITSDCLQKQRGRKGFRMRTFRHFTRATRMLRNGFAVLKALPIGPLMKIVRSHLFPLDFPKIETRERHFHWDLPSPFARRLT